MHDSTAGIVVITTGGTIDKAYYDALSQFQIGDSLISRLLTVAQVTRPYRILELLRKDSLELTDADRAMLLRTVLSLPERHVIITHGTDTMTLSAQVLATVADKVIVMTGALAPARFAESDAPFNLGMAVAAVQCSPVGVYIAMNGQVFPAAKVRKDRVKGCFVAID